MRTLSISVQWVDKYKNLCSPSKDAYLEVRAKEQDETSTRYFYYLPHDMLVKEYTLTLKDHPFPKSPFHISFVDSCSWPHRQINRAFKSKVTKSHHKSLFCAQYCQLLSTPTRWNQISKEHYLSQYLGLAKTWRKNLDCPGNDAYLEVRAREQE